MGCFVSQPSQEPSGWNGSEPGPEISLSPRFTAPPPPPLKAEEFAEVREDAQVAAGFGRSSNRDAAAAAKEAWAEAVSSLSLAAAPTLACSNSVVPSLTIVTCGNCVADPEEVRQELVRAAPEALLHGAATSSSILASGAKKRECAGKPSPKSQAVGCLLLQAPDGCFATAWDDCGDAEDAAKWLQEQMPDVKAIVVASSGGQTQKQLHAVSGVFPEARIFELGIVANMVQTLSHLGSSESGISLLGISSRVAFGASQVPLKLESNVPQCLKEALQLATSSGQVSRAAAAIVTFSGDFGDRFVPEDLHAAFGDLPVLGQICNEASEMQTASLGVIVFGEYQAASKSSCELKKPEAEDDVASVSTAWPLSPRPSTTWPVSPATDAGVSDTMSDGGLKSASC